MAYEHVEYDVGPKLKMIQSTFDPKERLRLIEEELESGYDDEPSKVIPMRPQPRSRFVSLVSSDPSSAEWVSMILNGFWGLTLFLNSSMFDRTPTLYSGNAKLADEWFWGLILCTSVLLHLVGYVRKIIRLRMMGVLIAASIWSVAAFAQLHSETFSPTPFALTAILLWLFMRLPAREA